MRRVQKKVLDKFDLIELAVLCQRIAADTTIGHISEEAYQLNLRWKRLVKRETPPPLDHNEVVKIQEEKDELRTHMVEFLASL